MCRPMKIPKVFFIDHAERDLPTPDILSETARHITICATDPSLPELMSDARHYADPRGTDSEFWLRRAAAALVAAVERQATA